MKKNQNKMPLFEALQKSAKEDALSFHIPSHKGGRGVDAAFKNFLGENVFQIDQSEIHGLDDLHQARGVIKEAQELAAQLWGAEETRFLVNGTTCGIMSGLIATAAEHEKVILPRNAHKSVYMSLVISGAHPIYVLPEYSEKFQITCGVDAKKTIEVMEQHKDAKGIFMIHPSYYGICGDLEKITSAAHEKNMIVIADEAHGNHMYFSDQLPIGGMAAGVDVAVQSTHKMSGSLTQSSMIHTKGSLLSQAKLKNALQMSQSTSPSYLLMASLDAARHSMWKNGKKTYEEILIHTEKARQEIKKIQGIFCMDDEILKEKGVFDYDRSKLLLSAQNLGLSGYELHEILYKKYQIECEFADSVYVVCVCGTGTQVGDLQRLTAALKDISEQNKDHQIKKQEVKPVLTLPDMILTPRKAYFAPKQNIEWKDAKNAISGEMIIPYPPGIPIVCQGERITQEIWEYLNQLKECGIHMQGLLDKNLKTLNIIKE